MLSNIDYL